MSDTTTLVQMRLRPQTIDRVEQLKEMLETENRTHVVVQSIRVTHWLAEELRKGNQILIKTPDGQTESVKVVGL